MNAIEAIKKYDNTCGVTERSGVEGATAPCKQPTTLNLLPHTSLQQTAPAGAKI